MNELAEAMFDSDRFQEEYRAILAQSVLEDLTAIVPTDGHVSVDWSYALFACSAISTDPSERSQGAALRIAQSCLLSDESVAHQRNAAIVLLERMGNAPAVELAERRRIVSEDAWTDVPVSLQLDVARRRMELSIPLRDGGTLRVNQFQRDFWTAAQRSRWVSASAPTSSGKSFIVRSWLQELAYSSDSFTAVYVVPTRALIEEVSLDMLAQFGSDVGVYSLPWDPTISSKKRRIFVFTQERLHLLHDRLPQFAADFVFVDEAQKFNDDERGVLLQRVIDEAVRRNGSAQVIYASPLADNPEMLLDGAPPEARTESLLSEMSTVSQNLLWVNQVLYHPREWAVEQLEDGQARTLGVVTLPARPASVSKRLSLVAVAIGRSTPGNVVYVNGAAEAEKVALQIYDAIRPEGKEGSQPSPDVRDLQELIHATIHREYALATVLDRGVAFHYGNMPLLVRTEIEKLFRNGVIQFLVCTSTLLEGVNLPCRNLFVRGPRRGVGRPMDAFDFWNLAGRAGRWGKEFQGNIVCIDTKDNKQWPDPPRQRHRRPIARAVRRASTRVGALVQYIRSGVEPEGENDRILEALFSLLASRMLRAGHLVDLPWLALEPDVRRELEAVLDEALEGLTVGDDLVHRHAGISPTAMERLLEYFRGKEDQTSLMVAYPEADNAAESYVSALSRCDRYLGSNFGVPGRQYQMAVLIRNWMRGYPMARIIGERVAYFSESDPSRNVAAVIRSAMTDIEQIARFEAPKYLACYLDLLSQHLLETGRGGAVADLPDVSMMLELGVSRETELSLVALGLSRASAIALGEYIVDDGLTPPQCRAWIESTPIGQLGLPKLVVREIVERLLSSSVA